MIRLRLAAGRRRKSEVGGFAYGAPPFGYRAEGRSLVPDEQEQATLRRIQDLHLGGASLRQIAAALASEGHPPKRGVRWHLQTLSLIIRRMSAGAAA